MSLPYFQQYIGGVFRDGGSGRLTSLNPASNMAWAEFATASSADIEEAVVKARAALAHPEWRDMVQSTRGRLLYKLACLIEENATVLGQIETQDSGKLLAETAAQTQYVADYYRYFAGLADKIEGTVLPIDKPDLFVYTRPAPIGVVAAIVPWNAQMFLTATKLGPALAAGCSVILKASEIAPIAMLKFAELIDQAGFPKGVVSVLTGDAKNCAIPLTSHPDIDRIAFTGGTEAARHVVHNSAENFAVTSLELGGKSPMLIFEDADLEAASNGLIAGNFGASGQSCVAGSRAIVSNKIKDRLLALVQERIKNVHIGDPLDPKTHIGPLCTKAQIARIEAVIAQSQTEGAELVFGGAALKRTGNYMPPTLLLCPHPQIAALQTELFGPVLSVLGFDEEEEAIALSNASPFGLGSGVFTENLARAHRVARHLRTGICWINTYRVISPIAPFGGFNQSGYGREAGIQSIQDYIRSQTVWVNTASAPMSNPFTIR